MSVAAQMGIEWPVSVMLSVELGTPVKIAVRSVGTNGG